MNTLFKADKNNLGYTVRPLYYAAVGVPDSWQILLFFVVDDDRSAHSTASGYESKVESSPGATRFMPTLLSPLGRRVGLDSIVLRVLGLSGVAVLRRSGS